MHVCHFSEMTPEVDGEMIYELLRNAEINQYDYSMYKEIMSIPRLWHYTIFPVRLFPFPPFPTMTRTPKHEKTNEGNNHNNESPRRILLPLSDCLTRLECVCYFCSATVAISMFWKQKENHMAPWSLRASHLNAKSEESQTPDWVP